MLKRKLILLGILFTGLALFSAFSSLQWLKLINEEYLYHNPKVFKKRLEVLPSNLNIESIKRIKASCNPKEFKFIVMSDSHGKDDVLLRVIADTLKHNPDFIIFLGDFTEQGKLRHYVKELNFIKKSIPVPFILVIGNHDYRNYGYKSYSHIFGPLDFYFDIGKYRFICIDNNFKEKVRDIVHLPGPDMEWDADDGIDVEILKILERLLMDGSQKNLIFMHQPPPLKAWQEYAFTTNREPFMSLMEHYSRNIEYVCAGHDHHYDMKKLHGIKFIVSGTTGGEFGRQYNRFKAPEYTYTLFTVDNNGINERTYKVN